MELAAARSGGDGGWSLFIQRKEILMIGWLLRKLTCPRCPFCREELEPDHRCALGQYFVRELANEARQLGILDTADRKKEGEP